MDVYQGCLALGFYDISLFCKQVIMPCIQVNSNGQKVYISIDGDKLEEVVKQIQLKSELAASSLEFERSRAQQNTI